MCSFKCFVKVLAACALCVLCLPVSACAGSTSGEEVLTSVEGEVLLFTDGVAGDGLPAAEAGAKFLHGEVLEKLESVPVYRVKVPAKSRDALDELCTSVMGQGIEGLCGAMVDVVFDVETPVTEPDVVSLFSSWDGSWTDWQALIHLDEARGYAGGTAGVKIGVVDVGFDFEGSGLEVEASDEVRTYCGDLSDNKKFHGTLVAELAGARNTDGVDGVAYRRTPMRCSAYGAFENKHTDAPEGEVQFSALMDAIGDCVKHGCKVISLSQAVAPRKGLFFESLPDPEALETSRQYAITCMAYLKDVLGYDFLVVQGAGNTGGADVKGQTGFFTCLEYSHLKEGIEKQMHVTVDPDAVDGENWSSENRLKDLFTQLRDRVVVVSGVRDLGGGDLAYDERTAYGAGVDILAFSRDIPVKLRLDDGVLVRDKVCPYNGSSYATPQVAGAASMLWAKYGGTAADVKEAIVGGSLTEVSHAQAGYMTGDCNDRYYVLDMAQAYRYRRQITDQEFLAIPWVFYGEMPDCGQENLRLEIGGIYGDGHLAHIRNQWAFHLSHERKVEKGDKVFEYNGECYGQFYPPQKDRDGNWWLRLMPVNAEPSVTGLDGYGGKLCLTKHCHWGYTSMDADGNMVEGRYEEPYGVRDLGLFQVFPRGTDVPELPRYMPEGKVKDGKLNCTMLYQEAEIPGYGGYVYCTR